MMRVVSGLRLAVGVAMLAAPRALTGLADPSAALLVRTIGVRDIVLGVGGLLAATDSRADWARVGLASDALDVVVGAASTRSVGRRAGLIATLVPVPFVVAGVASLRRSGRS